MAFTANIDQFRFGLELAQGFGGKRVLITGAGRGGGIGQALATAMNGAEVVGVHFHGSYRDGFDLVEALRAPRVKAFALQTNVTNPRDLDICNSGLTEGGYRLGRALPKIEDEGERRARTRNTFISNLEESSKVLTTEIDGFVGMSHLWAAEAVYDKHAKQFLFISSRQAIDPGVAVPGYVIAN